MFLFRRHVLATIAISEAVVLGGTPLASAHTALPLRCAESGIDVLGRPPKSPAA